MKIYSNELIDCPAIFDWDGTIVASVRNKAQILMECHGEYKIEKFELMKSIMKRSGIKRDIKIREILIECIGYDITNVELNSILTNYSNQLNNIENIESIPGFKEFIDSRKNVSYICSSAPRAEILSGLTMINVPHENFIIIDKVDNKSVIFKKIMEDSKSPIFAVGDSLIDYNAAISNNIGFIGVCYDNDELRDLKNILVINTYDDLVLNYESAQQGDAPEPALINTGAWQSLIRRPGDL